MTIDLLRPTAIKPISEVAVGDFVAIPGPRATVAIRGTSAIWHITHTVERLTATQFVTKEGRRFKIHNGFEINPPPGVYNSPALVVSSEYARAMAEFRQERARLATLQRWLAAMGQNAQHCPSGALEAMKTAYDSWVAANPEKAAP